MNVKKARAVICPNIFFVLILLSYFPSNSVSANNEPESYAIFSMHSTFDEISKSKARMIYRGKIKKLSRIKIQLSDWPDEADERRVFYDLLLGQTVSQVNGYWASLAFSGKGKQPSAIANANISVLIEWLQENPNGIGYAPLGSLPENAHVLVIISKGN